MHIQAYFSIFTLIMPSKAHQSRFNKYFNCCWGATLALLLSPADSSHQRFRQLVASDVGQWKVPLQQARDPGFLMPLVLHVFANHSSTSSL